jgi:sugar phosphate permease
MIEPHLVATHVPQNKLRILRSFTTLSILFVGCGCIFILPYLSTYLYIPMKDAMHLDNTQIGLMGSAMGFTAMIFYWPGGWVADRVSPRKLIAFSLIAHGLLGLWLATLPSFKALLTIQLLMGVFLTLTYWSAVIKMVRQLARSDQQGRYFGAFEGGRNVTAVVLVAAGLYLFDWLGGNVDGLRGTIILFSGILLAIGALSWIYLPEIAATVTTVSIDKGEQSLSAAIARVVRIPAVWLAMLIILCAYVTSAGSTYLTPYATDVYGQSVFFGGVLSVMVQATGIFAPPTAGFVADRWTTSRTTLWLLCALAACLSLFVIVPGGPRRYLLLLLNSTAIGCSLYALRGIYFALLEEGAVPLALTGSATGLISVVAYTPDVFMPVLAGHLLDRYAAGGVGYRYFFLILALFAATGVGFTLMFRYCVNLKPVVSAAASSI